MWRLPSNETWWRGLRAPSIASLLLGLLLLAACVGDGGEQREQPHPPQELEAFGDRLGAAGIVVSRLEALQSLRELPECPEARFRWRIHLGGEGGFFNVSRFDGAPLARACHQSFRSMALKGGAHAWERLRHDVAVEGPWMILFPPDAPSEGSRQAIVRALAGR